MFCVLCPKNTSSLHTLTLTNTTYSPGVTSHTALLGSLRPAAPPSVRPRRSNASSSLAYFRTAREGGSSLAVALQS